jgi:hypothetical protein
MRSAWISPFSHSAGSGDSTLLNPTLHTTAKRFGYSTLEMMRSAIAILKDMIDRAEKADKEKGD